MSGWEGYGVSVRCGALGCYQGTVAAADGGSITLTKPFRNGFPYPKARVTLKASDIESLEIISEREEAAPAHSTVLAGGRRRAARATVGESLQAAKPENISSVNPPTSGKPAPSGSAAGAGAGAGAGAAAGGAGAEGGAGRGARSKPVDIQAARPARTTHAGCGAAGAAPRARGAAGGAAARRRNEACFGPAALDDVQQDFDFEGNLALFDKEALWQQMRPDVVRVAAARDALAAGGQLRPDQHVLRRAAPDTLPVHVPPELQGPDWYVTDDGVRVPSLSVAARRRLWTALAAAPELPAALTLLARCAADVALRLMGGTRRLDPRNAHQRPVFGAALGGGPAGAAGAGAARLLAAHGVATFVLAPRAPGPLLRGALADYGAAGGRVLAPRDAPPPDVLLLALHDPTGGEPPDNYWEALEWAAGVRGALLLLEPGEAGAGGAGDARWARLAGAARAALAALLPGAAGGARALLANVAPPPRLFAALGVRYRPPFGAAAVLPLHRADDEPPRAD